MKIGIDIHGVIDHNPKFFSRLTKLLKKKKCEIHVITGARSPEKKVLEKYNIKYDHFFSILDYHTEIGTDIHVDEKGEEWILDEKWDRTKADYCKDQNIDIHIDDTQKYGNYFETGFIYYKEGKILEAKNINIENIKLFNLIREKLDKFKKYEL